ncbi:MAG: hypothetical protein WC462_04395 [archaeon]
MNYEMRIASVLVLFLVLISGAFACDISIRDFSVDVRGTVDFDSSISAARNTNIDVRETFYVEDYADDSRGTCPSNISARAIIYRYNNDTARWETLRTTTLQSQTLREGTFTFNWDDAFSTGSDNDYTRYRVVGKISATNAPDLNDLEEEAFVDVQDNSCSGIRLVTSNMTVDEGQTSTSTFRIENGTNTEFEINSFNIYSSNTLIKSGSLDYDHTVSPHNNQLVTVSIEAGYVVFTTTTSVRLELEGYIGNTHCSVSDIGRKNFDVTIRDTGATDPGTSSSGDCDDITINANSITMDESSKGQVTVQVKNDSTRRFEILEVKPVGSGVELSNYYNEKYIFPGQISDLVLQAKSPSVTQNKIFSENTIKVRGMFADGKTCSFSSLTDTFDITVMDQSGSGVANCSAFSISVPSTINIQNYGSIPFTIINGTNRKADIYLEGTVEIVPGVISIPEGVSVSRDAKIKITAQSGEVSFRPVIEGCSIPATRVVITNTAKGALSQLVITTKTTKDENTGVTILTVEITNPTTKTFSGELNVNAPQGWSAAGRTVSVQQGRNVFQIMLTPVANASQGNGEVTFKADGEEISAQYNTQPEGSFAGLFALGSTAGSIGIILLIVIAVLLLVSMIENRSPAENEQTQPWVEKKN